MLLIEGAAGDGFAAAAREQGALEENIWVNPIDSD